MQRYHVTVIWDRCAYVMVIIWYFEIHHGTKVPAFTWCCKVYSVKLLHFK